MGGKTRKLAKNSRQQEGGKIKELVERCKSLLVAGSFRDISEKKEGEKSHEFSKFTDLPISERTLKGLKESGFLEMTEVQKDALPRGLRGDDVLGAAKTGSGKTLAFLIPLVEKLYREKWSSKDGVGGIIITPTRELAYQIFEVLRKVGKYHEMSAGLIIGGKDIQSEQERIQFMNILICTPGRLLQHMDETPGFDCTSLEILVLDEADRIMDMGFEKTMNGILENLPTARQTLLFSATQTKSVKDLARLSLKDAEYVDVDKNSKFSTPGKLQQNYICCELSEKMNILWSFVKNHLKCKTLVFLSSCKQVRFMYESFRRLRPGVPVMALYGKQKQEKRMGMYDEFSRKEYAVLFATDIAARGLDFPSVHWVIQFDCPEDVNTYLHRVGRTARFTDDGHALMFLLPSEIAMVSHLEKRKVPIQEIKVNPKRNYSIRGKLEGFCAQDPDFKYLAQKTFISYIRSIHLQSDKTVFDLSKISFESFASALGLPGAPRIRFVKNSKVKKMGPNKISEDEDSDTPADDSEDKQVSRADSYLDKLMKRKQNEALLEKKRQLLSSSNPLQDAGTSAGEEEDDDDEFLTIKQKNHDLVEDEEEEEEEEGNDGDEKSILLAESKKSLRLLKSKVKVATKLEKTGQNIRQKTRFDENGNPLVEDNINFDETRQRSLLAGVSMEQVQEQNISVTGINIDESCEQLRQRDDIDKQRQQNRLKQKRIDEKVKFKKQALEYQKQNGGSAVQLAEDIYEHRDDRSDDEDRSDEADDRSDQEEDRSDQEEDHSEIEKKANHKEKESQSCLELKRKRKTKNMKERKKQQKERSLEEDEKLALMYLNRNY